MNICTDPIVAIVNQYQTLIGAVLGGIFALAVALIVARSALRAEQRTAAFLLISDLQSLCAAVFNIQKEVKDIKINEQDQAMFWVQCLIKVRPKMSVLLDGSVARVMPCNRQMAGHLSAVLTITRMIDSIMEQLETTQKPMSTGEKAQYLVYCSKQGKTLKRQYVLLAKHADIAMYYLDRVVLASFMQSIFFKWRSRLCPNEIEKKAGRVLQGEQESSND